MKKYLLFIILSFSFCKISTAQVLCIYCYDQNDTISAGVNNLLVNGGFESPSCITGSFCPASQYYMCNIPNWICTGGGNDTYSQVFDASGAWYGSFISEIIEGSYAVYMGNLDCWACSPVMTDTSCINNIDCIVTGIPTGYPISGSSYGGSSGLSIEQTVTGLITGNTYVLEFWAGGEFDGGNKDGLFAVDVGFGNTFLRDKHTNLGDIGTRYIIEFAASSSSHTIKFTNWGHIYSTGACTELVLDDVRLYTLAELDASVPHCTVGIDFPGFQNLENLVSPNPFSNELNVKTNNNDLSKIVFYDIASRKLLQQTFFNSTTINTSQLSKGIYFYEIKNKEGVVKKGKVVKE
jgi:hypothetical protein